MQGSRWGTLKGASKLFSAKGSPPPPSTVKLPEAATARRPSPVSVTFTLCGVDAMLTTCFRDADTGAQCLQLVNGIGGFTEETEHAQATSQAMGLQAIEVRACNIRLEPRGANTGSSSQRAASEAATVSLQGGSSAGRVHSSGPTLSATRSQASV